jgi:hypothetical protein
MDYVKVRYRERIEDDDGMYIKLWKPRMSFLPSYAAIAAKNANVQWCLRRYNTLSQVPSAIDAKSHIAAMHYAVMGTLVRGRVNFALDVGKQHLPIAEWDSLPDSIKIETAQANVVY